ncbi:capsid protein [Lepus americanus faeces associated genomovirus SHP111]|uniref:capsid protein n=1 Tax=Lepus americanus faeces associated genomovirus SHP111 TaxID=2219118 RepID=UPI000DF07F1D|nr:capsid protein [Lepus americanus faeces associated genomovirus SHP111]AXB22631.1 capsid protein [Lepus americanus faeces associated genomovirus SHP111]
MAYARRSSARRRYPARKSGSRKRQVSTKKRPAYRKKSRPMSKKRILNVTSRKKRDTMLSTFQGGSASTPGQGAYTTFANNAITIFPWVATGRDNSLIQGGAQAGTAFDSSTRSATTCYMRGLKEAIEIQTSTGLPWQWRRVCFTTKDPAGTLATGNGGISGVFENSNGFQRLVYNVTSASTSDTLALNTLTAILFKGRINVDWFDYMTAPLDTLRVTVKFDRTRTIASGNQSGAIRKFNLWHPMNKNLVYDDDEVGGAENASYYSVASKAGMGDYYVIDMIVPGKGGTSSDGFSFEPQATLYWHEK